MPGAADPLRSWNGDGRSHPTLADIEMTTQVQPGTAFDVKIGVRVVGGAHRVKSPGSKVVCELVAPMG